MATTVRPLTPKHSFTEGIEGPACDREGYLYAVNYGIQGTIGRVHPDGTSEVWLVLPEGSVASGIRFNTDGDMFIADYALHRIYRVNAGTREAVIWVEEPRMHQPNDLAIMSDGTLFASDPNWADGTGQVWRIDNRGRAQLAASGLGTVNGIEVDPQEQYLYISETIQRAVWRFRLDRERRLHGKERFHQFDDHLLDGMRCDMQGNLYVTRYGKGTIAQLSPAGELVREIAIQGNNCTNLCFGGRDGKTVYVTVADEGNVQHFDVEAPGRCWTMWGGEDL